MKQSFGLRTLVALVAVLLIISGMAMAQTSKGSIAGVVTDASEAVIPNATVTATAADGGETRSAISGPNGQYIINALNPGVYTVTVEAKGFGVLKVEKIDVKAANASTVNAKLQVSTSSETVTVEATAGQELQTVSGELSHNISPQEVKELPIPSLNPISLALTEPGVVAPASRDNFTNGVSFSVNGTRPRSNNFLIDGFDNNDASISGQAFQPQNLEAIGEVVLLTNSYAAEFGRGGGSVTNVTYKGGTNQFHGAVWDLYQNSKLNSRDASLTPNTPKAPMNDHTYGFSFGGPAVKDKLFFFGTAQWDRYRSSANGGKMTLPTDNGVAQLRALGPNSNIDLLLQAIGDLRGKANITTISLGGGRMLEVGQTQRSGVTMSNDGIQWNTRVDWIPNQKDTFTFRYLMDDSVFSPDLGNNDALPGFDSMQGGRSQNLGILHTHTFSPNLVNEFRFSFGRINFGFLPTAQTLANPLFNMPEVTIADFVTFGFSSGMPQGRTDNTFQYQEAVNWVKGNHTFKFGADIARLQQVENIPFNSRGTMSFVAGGTIPGTVTPDNPYGDAYSALANYIDNYTGPGFTSIAKVWGNPRVRPYAVTQAYYAQDAWRIKSNFTFNYGVRYEYTGTPANVLPYPAVDISKGAQAGVAFPNRVALKADRNNFAPRVSFAYTPKFWQGLFGEDKTVIRAGYGMFYDGLFNNVVNNAAAASPNAQARTLNGYYYAGSDRGYDNAFGRFNALTPVLSPTASVTGIASNLTAPITHQWNFDIQRELPGNFVLTTAYVGTRGIRLFANNQLNPADPDTGARINPARGAIAVRGNYGDSIYHGLNVKLDRHFSKGLLFRTAYTYSKMIDTASEVFVTSGYSSYPEILSNRRADRGLSAFDRRQRLVLSYVYEIPNLKTNNSFVNAAAYILHDWSISGTTSFQSGAPETVAVGAIDVNGDGIYNDRPNLGNANAPLASWAVDASNFFNVAPGTLLDGNDLWFHDTVTVVNDPNQYHWIVGPYGSNGKVGRNTMIGNGTQTWNFSIARSFKIPSKKLEGQQVQFRTELMNPFNHPNLGIPSYILAAPYFGDSSITKYGDREIRFWLKYSF